MKIVHHFLLNLLIRDNEKSNNFTCFTFQGKKFDFNKGFILNAAFNEARKFHGFDCFIFQDVDLVPDKLDNLYNCHGSPKHLSTAIDIRNYT